MAFEKVDFCHLTGANPGLEFELWRWRRDISVEEVSDNFGEHYSPEALQPELCFIWRNYSRASLLYP